MAGQMIAFPDHHQRPAAYLEAGRRRFGTDESSEELQPPTRLRIATELPIPVVPEHLKTRTLQPAMEGFDVASELSCVENLALRGEPNQASVFEEIVGTSPSLQGMLSRVTKVAPTDSTVLITGETGTGKELVARAIHKKSKRAQRAFISVNCAALAPSLIFSELFGHEKGAFTGATQRRLGRFELANGGTIFLDEVGELPPDTQVGLLRVLQEREFERVGGTRSVQIDVRVIAATNRNLDAAVANMTFRSDLYYRLNVFPIPVPPLRARKDDLLLLLEYFIHRFGQRLGKKFSRIDRQTLEHFQAYEWPGNIRELQNVVERSVILSHEEVFSVDQDWLRMSNARAGSRDPICRRAVPESNSKREIIEATLSETRGRITGPNGAAARLQVSPSTLDRLVRKLNIEKKRFRYRTGTLSHAT
jgi:transcriptional regulator with GAF, ATPase, and Fis domain